MPSGLRDHRDLTQDRRAVLLEDALGAATIPLGHYLSQEVTPAHLTRYQKDPVAWIVEVMGIPEHTLRWSRNPGYAKHTWDGTEDPLVAVLEALAAWENVGVESGTGTGKTFLGALIVLWWLDVFRPTTPGGPGGQVETAAPKEEQLRLHIWKEIGKLWPTFKPRHPLAELIDLRIRMRPHRDDWGAVGKGTSVRAGETVATKAAGSHAEHFLEITEETPGIHTAIMAAHENTCTAPHNLRLALGNPDHQEDELHRFCRKPNVRAVRISAHDHPNVVANDPSIVPGAVSRQRNAERLAEYGADDRLYLSRVRGISPSEAAEALIKLAWCYNARDKTPAEKSALLRSGPSAVGVDIANSERGDKGAVAQGRGAVLLSVPAWQSPDANLFYTLRVHPLITAGEVAPEKVGIDVGGVGAGAVNEACRVGKNVIALDSGSGPRYVPGASERFKNLRAQMWWQMRQDLHHGRIALPDDAELFADLTAVHWETRDGVIRMEPKEDVRTRLGRSPDKGDAAVEWNWMRQHEYADAPCRREVGSRSFVSG